MNRLEQYCKTLPNHAKVRLVSILMESFDIKESGKTFEMLHKAVVKVTGCEVLTQSRVRTSVIGRTILAYSCAMLGETEVAIGRRLHRDHCSINKMKRDMKEWLNAPYIFREENRLYNEFLNELNNETDGRTIQDIESI